MAHIDGEHIVVSVPDAVLVSDVVTDDGIMLETDLEAEVVEGPDICHEDVIATEEVIMSESILGEEVAIEEALCGTADHHELTDDLIEETAPDEVFVAELISPNEDNSLDHDLVSAEVMVADVETVIHSHNTMPSDVSKADDEEDVKSTSEDYLMISCEWTSAECLSRFGI